jgi:NAD(P)-dependent dehydrogenase (short-subunit alcohol dehydrogenase family)
MDVDLAVVTGGAGGLGRLITQRLAERGVCVVIADTSI